MPTYQECPACGVEVCGGGYCADCRRQPHLDRRARPFLVERPGIGLRGLAKMAANGFWILLVTLLMGWILLALLPWLQAWAEMWRGWWGR
jgi:hypothetical protein